METVRDIDLIREEARVWHAQLTSGHATAGDRAAFEAWRMSDPRCAAASVELEALQDALAADPAIAAMLAPAATDEIARPERAGVWAGLAERLRRGLLLPVGGALAAALIVGVFLLGNPGAGPAPVAQADMAFSTAADETREVRLADGSVVTLAGGSSVEVAYAPGRRVVRLTAGAATFAVAKNKARPFVVVAGNTSVRAVGTRFNVRLAAREVKVDVEEGVVEVFKPASRGAALDKAPDVRPVTLRAGEQVVAAVATGVIARPTIAVPAAAAAPAAPIAPAPGDARLRYVGAPLSDLVADAAARGERIRLASPEVGAMRLTTSFRASEIDAVIDNLPDVLPVEVVRAADGSVTISGRD